jgi:hypothetical protein
VPRSSQFYRDERAGASSPAFETWDSITGSYAAGYAQNGNILAHADSVMGRVAPVSVTLHNLAEGAPGPSLLGTGEGGGRLCAEREYTGSCGFGDGHMELHLRRG